MMTSTANAVEQTDGASRRVARLAWGLATLALLLMVGSGVLHVATGTEIDVAIEELVFFFVFAIVFAGLGALIASRHPRNAIGWLFLGMAMSVGVGWGTGAYADYWVKSGSGPGLLGRTAAVYTDSSWIPMVLVPATFLILLFPDGRLLSRRWRPVAWCAGLGIAAALLAEFFSTDPLSSYPQLSSPFGVHGRLDDVVVAISFPLIAVGIVGSVSSLIVRFRRAPAQERQQIKWLASAGAVAAVVVPMMIAFLYEAMNPTVATLIVMGSVLMLPLAAGVAILKYRLYDIDVVISRTLLVAGLAGFITAAYVGIVVGIGSLLGGGGNPNAVLSVVATTVVAVAFQPMRRWLQRIANRVVFGRRSTPYDVLSGFATRVGAGESSPDSLVHVAELLASGTGADPARVWLRVGPMLRAEAAWPVDAELVDPVAVDVEGDVDAAVSRMPAAELAVPVVERGELLGVLTIAKPRGERVSDVDVDLVHRLAAASGVVLRNLRLDAELAQRLEDLEASRRRLVSAQDDARRRIEAELAGGARAALDLVRDRLTELVADVDAVAAPKTAMLLGQLVDATDGALGTLAGLAAGVYPPRLAADGLVVALTEQAGKAALPVEVHADGVGRYPPEVEAAAYFAVLEALQNVAKYADATSAHVRLTDHDNALSFEVVDDGTGFDPATTIMGSGLQGITDRLDTVGGALTIASSPGAGTTITGHVPSAPSTAASVDVASKLAGVAS
jgi:signal transduction histidine kinase